MSRTDAHADVLALGELDIPSNGPVVAGVRAADFEADEPTDAERDGIESCES